MLSSLLFFQVLVFIWDERLKLNKNIPSVVLPSYFSLFPDSRFWKHEFKNFDYCYFSLN